MAGSSARRARRLNADNENTGRAAGEEPGSGEAPVARRPLNRTAAKRPTAARPAPKHPTANQLAADRQGPTPDVPEAAPPAPTGQAPLLHRIIAAIDKRGDAPDQLASSLRMRGNETTLGYTAAAVLAVVPVVFLTVTTGKGAPPHPATVAPAIGVVLALALAASIPLSNRILSAFLAVTSSLATTSSAVPNSVRSLSTVDLLVALGFAVWITLRQSKARNAVLAERRKANQAARSTGGRGAGTPPARGRRGRKAAEAAEPAGPPPSARYTPPKKRS